jgi:hypothetical protein
MSDGTNDGIGEELFNRLATEIHMLAAARRQVGEEEYGQFAFLRNDTFAMMYEELADLINYAVFTYVKIRIVEGDFEDELRRHRPDVDAGPDQG